MKTHFKLITLFVCLLFSNFGYGQDKDQDIIIDSLERRITALEHKVVFNQINNDFTLLNHKIENHYNDWRFMVLANDHDGLIDFYSMSSKYNDAIEDNYSSLKRLYYLLDSKYHFSYEENKVINSIKNLIDINIDQLKTIDKKYSKRW